MDFLNGSDVFEGEYTITRIERFFAREIPQICRMPHDDGLKATSASP
jgi:hypothetical protein